jgi:hypothetical protein
MRIVTFIYHVVISRRITATKLFKQTLTNRQTYPVVSFMEGRQRYIQNLIQELNFKVRFNNDVVL